MPDNEKEANHDDVEIKEDTQTDELELEDIENNSKDKLNALRVKLKTCEKEKKNHLENLHLAKAEFLNSKRRLDGQREIDAERELTSHIKKLLPLCDSFQLAMSDEKAWKNIDAMWRKGIESIHTQLESILTSYGVESINPQGELFNPELHEAVSTAEGKPDIEPETVIKVLQLGYTRNNELIRPAKVILSK